MGNLSSVHPAWIFLIFMLTNVVTLYMNITHTKLFMKNPSMPRKITLDITISEIMQSLRRIFKAIHNYSSDVSDKFGITGPQLWTLNTISKNEGLPLGELSEKMYLRPSTITGLVDRLEKRGYVVRDRDQKDRRVVKILLTPKGKALVKRAPNPIQGKMIYGLRSLNRGELRSIYDSIQKLVEIMEAQNVKATFFFHQE
jgi:MarR family transcriptional regulator, organic hydroperoxide resistance regulator